MKVGDFVNFKNVGHTSNFIIVVSLNPVVVAYLEEDELLFWNSGKGDIKAFYEPEPRTVPEETLDRSNRVPEYKGGEYRISYLPEKNKTDMTLQQLLETNFSIHAEGDVETYEEVLRFLHKKDGLPFLAAHKNGAVRKTHGFWNYCSELKGLDKAIAYYYEINPISAKDFKRKYMQKTISSQLNRLIAFLFKGETSES